MSIMDNVTVKVTIEVTKKADSWGSTDTIARSSVEETSSCQLEEIAGRIAEVVEDAQVRAQKQLANTIRIKELEKRNALLATPLKEIT